MIIIREIGTFIDRAFKHIYIDVGSVYYIQHLFPPFFVLKILWMLPTTNNIFPFIFREFNVFSIENFKFYFKSWTLRRISRMTKHVSKAGKVDPASSEIFL